MTEILLATLNARWTHASLGLRYLRANLGELEARSEIAEYEIGRAPVDVAADVLRREPRIVGFGVYIWNVRETTEVVQIMKRLAPEVRVVLGGPEVSFETDDLPLVDLADHVVRGEADHAFRDLCRELIAGGSPPKTLDAPLPNFADLTLPYDLYDDVDVRHRTLYVEASRGCPFECEFCLSALDIPVRQAPIEPFLSAMARLYDRGARRFKFVDRTFNLNLKVAEAILAFFLERLSPDLFLHFEMIPDRLPEGLRSWIRRFPAGSLQFEVGVQTLDDATSLRISRRQDVAKLAENLRFLADETGVHVHADLIVGLPGEDVETFARGFDALYRFGPHEIQVGVLKRLRGTPIVRHDATYGMVYAPTAPYEILRTSALDFETLLKLKRFAKTWDWTANSGNFVETSRLLGSAPSPFAAFLALSEHVHAATPAGFGVALPRLVALVFEFLVDVEGRPPEEIAPTLLRDYQRSGRTDRPPVLRAHLPDPETTRDMKRAPSAKRPGLERQRRREG